MAETDHYETLGVDRGVTQDELKRAYRKLAREHHPDANPDDPEAESRFKKLGAAYEVLSDPERRSLYDRFGTDDPQAARMSDPFASGLGDIFEAFFGGEGSPFGAAAGGSRGRRGPPRGEDLETHADLDLEDIVYGMKKAVKVRTAVRCESCEGTGAKSGTTPIRCPACSGSGQVRRVRQSLLGQMVTTSACPSCDGFGEKIESKCSACRGHGRSVERKSYTFEVPPGVEDGTTLRLTGKGAVGPRGGPNGDLYVHLRVRPHPHLRREGDNLVHLMHIPFTQAALGVTLDYETFDDTITIKIPRGTETGSELRIARKGVPRMGRQRRGDLLIRFVVDVPDDLTSEQAELVRQLAELRGEEVGKPRKRRHVNQRDRDRGAGTRSSHTVASDSNATDSDKIDSDKTDSRTAEQEDEMEMNDEAADKSSDGGLFGKIRSALR